VLAVTDKASAQVSVLAKELASAQDMDEVLASKSGVA
jgi:hypothetical protein